ncbi:hypothetical protein HDU80_007863 [Chytriomyces hyalinus]|nr:hypothetical protein HDU80_007863 [Chytriomyces hyalinus]
MYIKPVEEVHLEAREDGGEAHTSNALQMSPKPLIMSAPLVLKIARSLEFYEALRKYPFLASLTGSKAGIHSRRITAQAIASDLGTTNVVHLHPESLGYIDVVDGRLFAKVVNLTNDPNDRDYRCAVADITEIRSVRKNYQQHADIADVDGNVLDLENGVVCEDDSMSERRCSFSNGFK